MVHERFSCPSGVIAVGTRQCGKVESGETMLFSCEDVRSGIGIAMNTEAR